MSFVYCVRIAHVSMISILAVTKVVNTPTYDPPYESRRRTGIGVIEHSLQLYISMGLVFWYHSEESIRDLA